MATFRQVKLSFWTDHLVSDNFSAEDKYFFLYLLTNIHTNLCGCYEVSMKQIAFEMGYSIETIASVIDRFENKYNLIRYDRSTYELLIVNWSKHNWTESPKFRKLLEKEIESIKDMEFREYLMGIFNGEDAEIYPISIPDTVSETTDTSLLVSISNRDNSNSSNSENDINFTEVNTQEKSKKVRNKYEDTPEFAEFWNAYPKHQGKTMARAAFEKVDVPLQVLLDAIEVQKRSRQWMKDSGDFIPMPSTWLNQKRWEDSMDVNMPKSDGMERYSNLQKLAEEFDDE